MWHLVVLQKLRAGGGGWAGLEKSGSDRGRVAVRNIWQLRTRMQVADAGLRNLAVECVSTQIDQCICARGCGIAFNVYTFKLLIRLDSQGQSWHEVGECLFGPLRRMTILTSE
jgi:hypothetical protein